MDLYGARVGEVLGLERRDVDLLHRSIHVERTAYDVGGSNSVRPSLNLVAGP